MASRIIIEKRLAFREAALEKLYDAYTALVDGGVKSYMIDDRQLTRFDLPALSEEIKQMENEIAYRIAAVNEVHHRVKNNLQTIISLVGLEAAQTKNEEVKTFSKTIISRVRSISVTHDLLAHTGTDSVNLKTMLMRVVDGSLETNSVGQCHIRADISGDDLELTACGKLSFYKLCLENSIYICFALIF